MEGFHVIKSDLLVLDGQSSRVYPLVVGCSLFFVFGRGDYETFSLSRTELFHRAMEG